ncbi:MAG: DUF3237 family protein [Myxococcales bacterium]|nr:DUF3237 family protein [Myxococcales bacterium]
MEALELVPLCRAVIQVGEVVMVENTPTGNLMVGEIVGSDWQGERFRARLRGRAAADWLDVAPDGTATIDVRMTLETPGGGIVFVDYTGRSNLETCAAYACPRFRTGVPELAWLNRVQAVAKGFFDPQAMTVTYPTVYELR